MRLASVGDKYIIIASWSRVDTEWTPATDLIRNTTQAFIIVKALVALKVLSPHRKNEEHKMIFLLETMSMSI